MHIHFSINTASLHLSLCHTGETGNFTSHRSTLKDRAGRKVHFHFKNQSVVHKGQIRLNKIAKKKKSIIVYVKVHKVIA